MFFAWSLYFAFQSWLAASGKVARHRTIGMIGVSLATAMTIFGFLVAVNAMKRSAAAGLTDDGIAFAIVPLSGILFFAVVFALAIAAIRKPETHKRLMLLAGISLLDAAVARWFLTFLAPPGPLGPPPVPVTIPPAFVAYLLLVVAMVFDWRTRGRPHPVYVYGGIALIAVKLLNWPISVTPLWHSFAGGILAMAQYRSRLAGHFVPLARLMATSISTGRNPRFASIRMDYRAAAWRGGAVRAGAAAQGALSDISCDRRHVAGLRARGSVVDAGA